MGIPEGACVDVAYDLADATADRAEVLQAILAQEPDPV